MGPGHDGRCAGDPGWSSATSGVRRCENPRQGHTLIRHRQPRREAVVAEFDRLTTTEVESWVRWRWDLPAQPHPGQSLLLRVAQTRGVPAHRGREHVPPRGGRSRAPRGRTHAGDQRSRSRSCSVSSRPTCRRRTSGAGEVAPGRCRGGSTFEVLWTPFGCAPQADHCRRSSRWVASTGGTCDRPVAVRPGGRGRPPLAGARVGGRRAGDDGRDSVMRAARSCGLGSTRRVRPLGMTFARCEVLMLLLFSARGPTADAGDRRPTPGAPDQRHEMPWIDSSGGSGPADAAPR